jgi:flagellar biosynthetic protein FlhB
MADNETSQQDRTEQPSAKKLADAKLRGRVPRSRELTASAVMLAGAGTFLAMRPIFGRNLGELFASGLSIDRIETRSTEAALERFAESIGRALEMLAPLWIVLIVAALLSPLAVGGWTFSAESLAVKLDKLNPVTGLKRVFGWTGLSELFKALAKFLVVAIVAAALIWQLAPEFFRLASLNVETAIDRTSWLVALCFAGFSAALLLIAAYDVPFQIWHFHRELRMTKQEVRDEQKETEGRPEIRARIRNAQQDIANQRMMADVPKADVVAMNPTHYAVALRYDGTTMKAPKVVAKGADLVALSIRRIAEAHGVPVFEHAAFARALYHNTNVGQEISPRLYVAVAQVLTYIYQLTGRAPVPGRGRPDRPDPEIEADLLLPARARRRAERGLGT